MKREEIVTVEHLMEFKEDILREIRLLFERSPKQQTQKKWIKSADLRKMLGISAGKLHALRENGTLPHVRLGSNIYYDMAEVEKMLEKHIINGQKKSFETRGR